MADTTYNNQSVYRKQGGDEEVVATGGLITVESGGQIDIETGGEISIESGGTIDVEAGGGIDIESGGDITLESGGTFTFFNDTYTASQMLAAFVPGKTYNFSNASTNTNFDDVGGSSPPVIPSGYGTIVFDASTGLAAGSVRLYSANYIGQKLRLMFLAGGGSYLSTGGLSVYCEGAGDGIADAKLIDVTGVQVSHLNIGTSGNSFTTVDLLCIQDGLWAVIDQQGLLASYNYIA